MTELRLGRWPGAAEATEGVARDGGDIILGWLTRVVIGICATAVIGFDGLSIGVAHISAMDDANSAARAASQAWHDDHGDPAVVLHAAQQSAAQHGETVLPNSIQIDSDGTVHLRLERTATTLLVKHVHPLRSWARVVVGGDGHYAPD